MFATIARAVFGTANDRSLKAYQRRVPQITRWNQPWRRCRTTPCGPRPQSSASGWPVVPLWTTCRRRPSPRCAKPPGATLGQRHFDVQLVGGMVLHDGKIRRDEDR